MPIGAGDRPNLIQQIQALQPKGKTPITGALNQAAEQLRAVEEETSVVLVSDGKESLRTAIPARWCANCASRASSQGACGGL
ncbi:MAG: hypothetical protein HC808_11405 [Candidatus Competibacteraceae bacterium]|nr:hypothetical protein [Candidatus Competibacteraceae bacterium]